MSEKVPNKQKQETYARMKVGLNRAIQSRFYYEAIFIEYAIVEDRCTSMLKHAGVNYWKKTKDPAKPQEKNLRDKLNLLKDHHPFTEKELRKKIARETLDRADAWREKRNDLIHHLANIPYDSEAVEQVALEGNDIVDEISNAAKRVTTYFEKQEAKKNNG